jgi:hypothetical protein
MGFITADARATWTDTEPTGIDAAAEELVTWGASSSADLYCWLTHGEPEDWPVVVFSHGDDTWTRFDCGMTEFIRRVFSAHGRVEAMKDSALWGAGSHRPGNRCSASCGESSITDQGAGDACEGKKVLGLAFIAAVLPSAAGQPGHAAFDVPVGPGNTDGQGQTGPFSEQVDLRSVLAPVHRIRIRQLPLFRARMFIESIAHRDQSSSPREPS